MSLTVTRRGAWLAPVAIVAATYTAGVLGNLAAGPELPATTSTGVPSGEVGASVDTVPLAVRPSPPAARPTPSPSRASRSRATAKSVVSLNWVALAKCESGGNPRAVSPNGLYYGLYQFDERTWRSVGGTGNPADASPAEQTRRARLLYAARGAQPWPVCGRWLRG